MMAPARRAMLETALVLTLALAAPLRAQEDPLARPIVVDVPEHTEYTTVGDIAYAERAGRTLLMDIYLPADAPAAGVPAVLFVHGGPLPTTAIAQGKDLGQYSSWGGFVTGAGLAAVTFSHGFSGLDAFQQAAEDVETAIRHVRSHAAEYGIDGDRLCVVVVSAGGAFLAPILEESPEWLKCVAVYYAVLRPGLMESVGAGEVAADQRAGLDPLPHVASMADPPALLIAEAGRDAAPINGELRRLRDVAMDADWPVEYWTHPDGPHGFDVFDDSPRSRRIVQRTRAFLREQLLAPRIRRDRP